MTKTLGIELLIWGLLLPCLGLLANQFLPEYGRVALITAVSGGMLLMVCGAVALAGNPRKVWSLLTLTVVCFILLSQTVSLWMPETPPKEISLADIRKVALLVTLMLAGSFGLLLQIAYTGVAPVGARALPEEKSKTGGASRSPAGFK